MVFQCTKPYCSISKAQEIFKMAGFKDKNRNNVIEKESFWNWWTDEGYKAEADIDKDGKIILAEAKYYLQFVKNVKLKKEQKITRDEQYELQNLFRTQAPVKDKTKALRMVKFSGWLLNSVSRKLQDDIDVVLTAFLSSDENIVFRNVSRRLCLVFHNYSRVEECKKAISVVREADRKISERALAKLFLNRVKFAVGVIYIQSNHDIKLGHNSCFYLKNTNVLNYMFSQIKDKQLLMAEIAKSLDFEGKYSFLNAYVAYTIIKKIKGHQYALNYLAGKSNEHPSRIYYKISGGGYKQGKTGKLNQIYDLDNVYKEK